jgi:hypothetical protein
MRSRILHGDACTASCDSKQHATPLSDALSRQDVREKASSIVYSMQEKTGGEIMIYRNVELHNIEEVFDIEGMKAVGMQRVPEKLTRLETERCRHMPFAPRVCRVMLRGGPIRIHDIGGSALRPPRATSSKRCWHTGFPGTI